MNIRRYIFACGLGLLSSLLWVGCGSPNEPVVLRLERRALETPEKYKLWVIKDKLKDGKSANCADFLKKGASFDPEKFDIEKSRDIAVSALADNKEEVTEKALTPGKKLFVGAGYGKGGKSTEPVAVGCVEGEIKGGGRLFVSIFLATLK